MNKEIIAQVAFKGAIECVVNGKAELDQVVVVEDPIQ